MTDITDLQDIVVTLEYHEEQQHAELLREYVEQQRGWKHRLFGALKSALAWFITIGAIVAIVYGFIESMLTGAFLTAFTILLFGTVVLAVVTLIHEMTDAVYDWYAGEMPMGQGETQ